MLLKILLVIQVIMLAGNLFFAKYETAIVNGTGVAVASYGIYLARKRSASR